MRLYVSATGSTANTYVLSGKNGESLILDAGAAFRKVLPYFPDVRKVEGCLITHEHADHSRAWQDYSMRGITVCMSRGTYQALESVKAVVEYFTPMIVTQMKMLRLGAFTVMPFAVQHDAAEPIGFLIRYNPTGETMVYATDTYYLKYTFPGVNYWLVECNYIDELVDGDTEAVLKRRLKESHMSLRHLKEALSANDLTETAKIVLVHLSDSRSDENRMVSEIEELTGIETVAASDGMRIPLNTTPF